MSDTGTQVIAGSGNVFAAIGLPDAEEMLLKADLAAELGRIIAARTLTGTRAAEIVGLKQGDLFKLLRGSLRGHSAERLRRMPTAFDRDVEIAVRPHAKAGEGGRVTFARAQA